jgi:hypothetical protein
MNEKTPVRAKKAYETPVLCEYGNIGQITQNSTNSHPNSDNGSQGASHKTNG